MSKLSRREFLKMTGAFSTSVYLPSLGTPLAGESKKKVLILLFDTMSARHLSIYGYPRETTPNFSRFAERATVFHSHYSAANFTSPATASMMMGMYPWKHRAYTQGGLVRRDLVNRNLFALLGNDFYRVSFAQTSWADVLMKQFSAGMEKNLSPTSFSISGSRYFMDRFLREKSLTHFLWEDFATYLIPDLPGTLLGGYLSTGYLLHRGDYYRNGFSNYPIGIPNMEGYNIAFRLEDVFAGVYNEIRDAFSKSQPHFSYYHLFAPHDPFKPREPFYDFFKDDYQPLRKPKHPLSENLKYRDLVRKQQIYDRYIANVDYEFGVLIDRLGQDGLLDDTYVIVTSDHGELFERASDGHGGPLLCDAVIHIPLLIRTPGQTTRTDVYTRTSNVDILPTLLSLLGRDIPKNVDGTLLPGLGGKEDSSRAVYTMVSPRSSAFGPLHIGTFTLQLDSYKLIFYRGYKQYLNMFEFFNMEDDPEELVDLMPKAPSFAKQMKEQLLDALAAADSPYL